MSRAACLDHTDLFANDIYSAGHLHAAQEVCQACPVSEDCRAYAAAIRPTWGVWAGREYRDREVLARG